MIQHVSPSLHVSGLTCERDGRFLFRDLSFTLEAGQLLQIFGSNGSGKTTLMRIVAGLNLDYSGDIVWQGVPVAHNRPDFQADLLYMGHQPGIKPTLSAEENLVWAMGLHGHKLSRDDIWQALASVGLAGFEDLPCYQLSAGQNRRVALARLVLAQQPLWILDEPFTAIDRQGVAALEQTLVNHAQQGGLVMMTTHHEMSLDYQGFGRLALGEQP